MCKLVFLNISVFNGMIDLKFYNKVVFLQLANLMLLFGSY